MSSTCWGDFGYLEICLDYGHEDLRDLARWYEDDGLDLLQRPISFGVAGDYEIWFMYVRDPDGNPMELLSEMPVK